MLPINFLRQASPGLGLGFLMAFGSGFGQTYFIALFSGEIRADMNLSHTSFSVLYTIATLASGLVFLWLGKAADHIDITTLGIATALALTGFTVLLAYSTSLPALCFALFGLRLCGQGMLGHLSMTAMARWFDRHRRGRALSIAALGYPTGESLFPPLAAILLALMTWREVWQVAAFSILLIMIPLIFILGGLVRGRGVDQPKTAVISETTAKHISWTRSDVLRDVRFYALLPGIMAPPFMITGALFHQVHLVETKNWILSDFAALYPFYATSSIITTIAGGWLIDRFGAAKLLPIYLLPMSLGLALMAATNTFAFAILFMLLLGSTASGATVVLGTLWAELYGTDHLGAIRSLSMSILVLATAISPGLMGYLLDADIGLEVQFMAMSAYCCAYSFFFILMQPLLRFVPPSSSR